MMLSVTQKAFPSLLRGAARCAAPAARSFGDTVGFDRSTHKLIDDQHERALAVEAVYFKKEDARLMKELLEKETAAEKLFHELAEKYQLKPTEARALKSTWKSKVVLGDKELLERESAAEKKFHEIAETKYDMKLTEARALKSAWKSKVVKDQRLDPNNVLFGIECQAENKTKVPTNKQQIDPNCVLFGLDLGESSSAPPPCKSMLNRKVLVLPKPGLNSNSVLRVP